MKVEGEKKGDKEKKLTLINSEIIQSLSQIHIFCQQNMLFKVRCYRNHPPPRPLKVLDEKNKCKMSLCEVKSKDFFLAHPNLRLTSLGSEMQYPCNEACLSSAIQSWVGKEDRLASVTYQPWSKVDLHIMSPSVAQCWFSSAQNIGFWSILEL